MASNTILNDVEFPKNEKHLTSLLFPARLPSVHLMCGSVHSTASCDSKPSTIDNMQLHGTTNNTLKLISYIYIYVHNTQE